MVRSLLVLLLLGAPLSAQQASYTFMILPILQYVYFDTNSSELPTSYHQYSHPEQTPGFREDTLSTIHSVHYSYLDLLGSRMRKHPETTVTLKSMAAGDTPHEKDTMLALRRAEAVKTYLVNIWQIDPNRVRTDVQMGFRPALAANEFRRVQFVTDDWELYKPVSRLVREAQSNKEYYALLDFRYSSTDMGKQNERIVAEYIAPRMGPGRKVTITGFVDREGLEDQNNKLGEHRAKATREVIRKLSKAQPDTFIVRSAPDHVGGDRPAADFMIARRVEIIIEF